MITFYDIPSKLPGKAWSPNTFKTRISLNYKEVPYKTEWIEYPDIEPTLKKLGGAPTSKKDDGRDHYTLPAIHDSATGKFITDSTRIAEYLDATYPDKPLLFPPGSRHAAVAMLEDVTLPTIFKLIPLLLPGPAYHPSEASVVYVRSTREKLFGKKLEKLALGGNAIVIAALVWTKLVLETDSAEWKAVASWSDGRWGKLTESTKELQAAN
ncbi:hypothetical protein ACEPAH_7514 [Sanghuangporus vaninii]